MSQFTHIKFLVDNNKTDFITDLYTYLTTYECDVIHDQINNKYNLQILSNDPNKLDKAFEFVLTFINKLDDLRLPKFWINHFQIVKDELDTNIN